MPEFYISRPSQDDALPECIVHDSDKLGALAYTFDDGATVMIERSMQDKNIPWCGMDAWLNLFPQALEIFPESYIVLKDGDGLQRSNFCEVYRTLNTIKRAHDPMPLSTISDEPWVIVFDR
jgi:hypothetical protein